MTETQSSVDTTLMQRALVLAERGLLTTRPNPAVGCVIAHQDKVVGEGYHERAGGPHAEVHALREAGEAARGATAYVTLEPCAHHGRTPPCAAALVAAGVARVVAAGLDPNPKVAGAGLAHLRKHGIATASGLLEAQARELNAGFLSRFERGRPWLRLKLATSLDGHTALGNGVSQWITSTAARQDVQLWRARSGAILTGADTVIADDPAHTVRIMADGTPCTAEASDIPQPMRIVADTRLRTPASARLLTQPGRVVVAHASESTTGNRVIEAGAELLAAPRDDAGLRLDWLLTWLAQQDINDVFTEAGPKLLGALLAAGLVDEVLWYLAPNLLGLNAREALTIGPFEKMADRIDLRLLEHTRVGADLRLRLKPVTVASNATPI